MWLLLASIAGCQYKPVDNLPKQGRATEVGSEAIGRVQHSELSGTANLQDVFHKFVNERRCRRRHVCAVQDHYGGGQISGQATQEFLGLSSATGSFRCLERFRCHRLPPRLTGYPCTDDCALHV